MSIFDMLWGKLKGVREGVQHQYPSQRPSHKELREVADNMGVNDYVICPSRREAARVFARLRRLDADCMTRSVMYNGKEAIKVWRIR
tara:strand:+ start:261 stop:521 length:261 start_codon:yes stop_codon:yes gene_type:complete